jgi:hypothetical protein
MSTPCAHVASASRHEHGPSVAAEKQMSIRLGHGLSRWARRCRVVQCAHGVRRVLCVPAASRIFLPCRRGARSPPAHDVGTADLRSAPWPRVQGLDVGWPVIPDWKELSKSIRATFFTTILRDGDPRHTPRGSAMATRRSRIPDPRRSFRRSRPGRRTGGPPSCSGWWRGRRESSRVHVPNGAGPAARALKGAV